MLILKEGEFFPGMDSNLIIQQIQDDFNKKGNY
jgi:hypothetical protein